MAELHIYKSGGGGFDVKIDESTVLQQRLFGENVITSTFTARQVLSLDIGDYIVYDNIKYYINTLPIVTKNARNNYEYTITFESQYYDLSKAQFMFDEMGEFDFAGTADDFIDILITNLARVFGAGIWTKGTVDPTNTDVKLLHFSAVNCAEAMVTISNEFGGEFYYDNKEISFTDEVGSDISVTLQYKSGLFNFTRNTVDTKNIITRIYPFGSQKNIDYTTYNYDRLRPTPDGGHYYFDQNTDLYGIIEHTKIFEDIFPTRTGTISDVEAWVGTPDTLDITDDAIDFDLNSYLLPGVKAKMHFQTGECGGYECEISEFVWNNPGGVFTIVIYEDGQGFKMPNSVNLPVIGDTYKLIDIKMPASYITTAEDLLQTKALAYLAENSSARVSYSLSPDWKYLKTNGIDIKIGDFITVEDSDLGITSLLRVVYLSRQLMNQWKCTLELSDDYVVNLPQRVYADNVRNKRRLEFDNVGDVIQHRRNWRSTEELREMVFDPDGYFDVDSNIRPLSVTTAMLSVGVGSQQFTLSAEIEPNYTGDASKVETGAGYLSHFTIDPTTILTWTIYANSYTSLTSGTAYYIYAKCHKTDYTNANNKIVLDTVQRNIDDDATYYYFLIGILHSVVDSVRGISLTYGQTTINGKFITTGKIQSASGTTYFDLDNNTLVIGSASGYANISDKPTSLSGINSTEGSKLTGIASGATVGATWGTNVASIPARFTAGDTPTATGVFITPNYIGFYDSTAGAWPIRIKNNSGAGEFYIGDGTKYISYASGTVTVRGDLEAISGTDKVHITTGTYSGNDYSTINLVRSGNLVGFLGPYQPTVATEPRLSLVSANGGSAYFAIGTDPFDTSNARSSFINHDCIQVITSDTGDALVYAERTGDDTSAPIICSKYSGSGTGILFQGIGSSVTKFEVSSLGKIKAFNMQLYDTDPTITGHDGSSYTKLVFNAGTYEIKTSGTAKITIDASGNIDTAGVYKKGGTQVVGARVIDARCDDSVTSTWSATEAGVLDSIRDAMITHGLIAAS
jgi:hypothetical protein